MTRFRCHIGHAYMMDGPSESQERALDTSLFDALRTHKGRVALIRQMARCANRPASRSRLEARGARFEEDAVRLEEIIRSRKPA